MYTLSYFRRLVRRDWRQWYALASLVILFTSTAICSFSGALLQQNNADQLVNSYLLSSVHIFQEATFPASHTQLLKWPLFWLPNIFHDASWAFELLTVLLVACTVSVFAYLLYRITLRKPVLFGTACLLFSSVLVVLPVFASDVTTPVGLVMFTGRNIEYIIYIGALVLLLKSRRLTDRFFIIATVALTLLLASDHLFAWFTFGGSGLLLVTAWIISRAWAQDIAIRWLAGSTLAWILSLIVQALVGHTLTHIVNDPTGYGTNRSISLLLSGVSGTVQALGLNFGITARGGYWSYLAVLCNAATVALILCAGFWVVRKCLASTNRPPGGSAPLLLSIMLISTSVAAIFGFVVVNQPYVEDARYLMITLFSGFTVLATWARGRIWQDRQLMVVGAISCLAVVLGLVGTVWHSADESTVHKLQLDDRQIATLLTTNHVEYLVGYYWRVVPIKELSPSGHQQIVPLENCLEPLQVLGSEAWQPQLLTHSFAYLLTDESSVSPGQNCRLSQVAFLYGPPTSIVIIHGTERRPTEELLFYAHGASILRDTIRQCHQVRCLVRPQ